MEHARLRILILPGLALLGLLCLCACTAAPAVADATPAEAASATPEASATPQPAPDYFDPVSRVEGKAFLVRDENGDFSPFFVKGVDIGAAKPGYWPGEFGIPEEDYLRWFHMIGELNANTIRVYVPQMPGFYNALLTYNSQADQPLYLLQGIYMNEEFIVAHRNAFQDELLNIFYRDLSNTIDIVHGNATVEKLPGNAGGEYRADVSAYVIGYLPGIEFSSDFVLGTNEQNPDKASFSGAYVKTENASPFEVFLAEAQNYMIDYEQTHYGVQRPISITNWVTTGPLPHPGEPNPSMEDAVSVDVEHIKATDAYTAGFFASYHVYPYYPDMMSYDPAYVSGENPNPYRAYLAELNAYHTDLAPRNRASYNVRKKRKETNKGAERRWQERTTQLNRSLSSYWKLNCIATKMIPLKRLVKGLESFYRHIIFRAVGPCYVDLLRIFPSLTWLNSSTSGLFRSSLNGIIAHFPVTVFSLSFLFNRIPKPYLFCTV